MVRLVVAWCMISGFGIAQAIKAQPVSIPDENLKALVQDELGLLDPNQEDMLGLISLNSNGLNSPVISDLTGLEFALNLTTLLLNNHQVTDLSPLADLPSLSYVTLKRNQVHDLFPLTNLTALQVLDLSENVLHVNAYCFEIDLIRTNNPGLSTGVFLYDISPYTALGNESECVTQPADLMSFAGTWLSANVTISQGGGLFLHHQFDYDFSDTIDLPDFAIFSQFWLID